MEKHRKQIAFDLDTKMLEKYYPTENWRKAYEDIKSHMKANSGKSAHFVVTYNFEVE